LDLKKENVRLKMSAANTVLLGHEDIHIFDSAELPTAIFF